MNKQKWMDSALEMGFDAFEIYQSQSYEKEIAWFEGKMDRFETSDVLGTSIRGIIHGKMANLALEQVQDEKREVILQQLKNQILVISSKDKDSLRFPEKMEWIHRNDVWISPDASSVYDTMKKIEQMALSYDEKVIQVAHLSWHESMSQRWITNSLNLDLHDADCLQYMALSVVVKDKDEIKDHTEIELVHDLKEFNVDVFVSRCVNRALEKLNSTSYPSSMCPVIFEKEAMTSLFSSFSSLFSGDLIHKGISCLKGKENTKIFSDAITITDNPRNTGALMICNFDDEGCPTKKKTLVDHGVFMQMLHSTKSANRMHTQSTGNGFKSGYASSISVQPMNCCIEPGHKSLEEMCEKMQNGLVITNLQGLHSGIDFASTNFSLQASGYAIVNGKKDHSVSLITVAGNFMELMNQVIEVGNDLDWKYYSVVSPSIYFKECAISGE
ncbi:MAG: TldD/PmbA family protein [Floccifex sp.]